MIITLKEAIQHCNEKAQRLRGNTKPFGDRPVTGAAKKYVENCLERAEYNEQLASLLEELKDYREGKRTCENCKYQNKTENQYPCSICRCNHPNMFEWAKESEDK